MPNNDQSGALEWLKHIAERCYVSEENGPLYVAEFQFRYNNRGNEDIFGAAIRGC